MPKCPIHNIEMVLRIAKQGNNVGHKFYGCPLYPKCKKTVNISYTERIVKSSKKWIEIDEEKQEIINKPLLLENPLAKDSKTRSQEVLRKRKKEPRYLFSQYPRKRK